MRILYFNCITNTYFTILQYIYIYIYIYIYKLHNTHLFYNKYMCVCVCFNFITNTYFTIAFLQVYKKNNINIFFNKCTSWCNKHKTC